MISKSYFYTMKNIRLPKIIVVPVLIFSAGTLLMVLHKANFFDDTAFSRALQNFGHYPLFGVLALIILKIIEQFNRPADRPSYIHYLFALFISSSLGLLSEVLQIPTERNADLMDLMRDIFGATTFLFIFFVWSERKEKEHLFPPRITIILTAFFLITFLYFITPVAEAAYVSMQRMRTFPTLSTFEKWWQRRYIYPEKASYTYHQPPENWIENSSTKSLKVNFSPQPNAGIGIYDWYHDWTGYDSLTFDIFSPSQQNKKLVLRINDRKHNGEYLDRYNTGLPIEPGHNHITISLQEIKTSPHSRTMKMDKIYFIVLFAPAPKERFTLFFDNFALK